VVGIKVFFNDGKNVLSRNTNVTFLHNSPIFLMVKHVNDDALTQRMCHASKSDIVSVRQRHLSSINNSMAGINKTLTAIMAC
jgi:hypothetical protein